jgi:type I restriction enzyme M protein
MAQISIVPKSQLAGAMRLDAEYYQPKYTNAADAVRKHGSFSDLGRIAKVLRGRNPRAYSDNGIPIIRAIDLRDLTKTEDFLYANPAEELFFLKPRDILISSIGEGSIGKVSVFQDDAKCATVSEVSVVRSTDYNPYALATFLRSKYGYLQLERRITGSTGQLHLYPKDIITVIVPLLPSSVQQTIEEINIEAAREARKSRVLYFQAEQLLLDESDFKNLDLSPQLYYTMPFKKTKEANRLDAEHFQPKYERLLQHLASTGKSELLGNLVVQPVRRGLQPTYIEGGGVIVVNSKYVGRQFVNIEQAERTDLEFWQGSIRAQARKCDVIINSTGWGTIGRANCILHDEKTLVDNHVAIIRPDKQRCNPVYLALYLNSNLGRMQTEKWLSGSSGQIEIYPSDIARYIVYLPLTEFQHRIADLVIRSWEARQKARQLLEEAKKKVENLIEGKD